VTSFRNHEDRSNRSNSSDSDLDIPSEKRSKGYRQMSHMSKQSYRSSRSRRNESPDLSPPRRSNSKASSRSHDRDYNGPGRRRQIAEPEIIQEDSPKHSSVTLEGKRAGLQTARDLRNEMVEFRERENEMFAKV